jgi:hypothetical protein
LAHAGDAYRSGNWAAAAELARDLLASHKDDLAALRLWARASARLGRDDVAMNVYERRLNEKHLEAEDYLVVGMMLDRQKRGDAAARAWKRVLADPQPSPVMLEELTRLCARARLFDDAILAAERLGRAPGWKARGELLLGTLRVELNNTPAAAVAFRNAIELDATVVSRSRDPVALSKLIARTFLKFERPDLAKPLLHAILERGPDGESSWLLSRAYLQDGDKPEAMKTLKQSGTYRADNLLDAEPGPFVGEGRCEKCHTKIFRESLATRHTQTFYRGAQLRDIPLPSGPLPDPDDPQVTHSFERRDGVVHAQTKVGREVFHAVVDYAFGTSDRYLTLVSRDATAVYHTSRLSYYDTSEGKGWDRTTLDMTHPTPAKPADFLGEAIGVRDGLARCLYCHVTNPRTGSDAPGPELADRAIGCERCHGPGGNHLRALEIGFPDMAIVNPTGASPAAVTARQCNDCHVLERNIQDDDIDNPGWIRSQGIGWARSRCNTESGEAFGCVTCHSPHQSARAKSSAEYEAKCLSCHAARSPQAATSTVDSALARVAEQQRQACPVNPRSGCLECHMPQVKIDSLHMKLTDHHIRVHRDKAGTR